MPGEKAHFLLSVAPVTSPFAKRPTDGDDRPVDGGKVAEKTCEETVRLPRSMVPSLRIRTCGLNMYGRLRSVAGGDCLLLFLLLLLLLLLLPPRSCPCCRQLLRDVRDVIRVALSAVPGRRGWRHLSIAAKAELCSSWRSAAGVPWVVLGRAAFAAPCRALFCR